MTIDNADPIEYIFCRNPKEAPEGYTVPGWYFWNEVWCDVYGPYESPEEAREKLRVYCVANEMI